MKELFDPRVLLEKGRDFRTLIGKRLTLTSSNKELIMEDRSATVAGYVPPKFKIAPGMIDYGVVGICEYCLGEIHRIELPEFPGAEDRCPRGCTSIPEGHIYNPRGRCIYQGCHGLPKHNGICQECHERDVAQSSLPESPEVADIPDAIPQPLDEREWLEGGSAYRKSIPIVTGCLDYFPLALAEVSIVSKAGNDKHSNGVARCRWTRGKSSDHIDCAVRHIIDRGRRDSEDGQRHLAHAAWRILAALQIELEQEARQEGRL